MGLASALPPVLPHPIVRKGTELGMEPEARPTANEGRESRLSASHHRRNNEDKGFL